MSIKLRKQLNIHQGGGNVLDSPNGGNQPVASSTIVEPTPSPEPSPSPELLPEPTPIVVDPNNPNPNPEPTPEPVDKQWFEEANALVGVELEGTFDDSFEGIANWGSKIGEKMSTQAVQNEYEELQNNHPSAVELIQWQRQNPNRDEKEFFAAKLGTPSIDPETLDANDNEKHRDILYKDFMRRGLSEKMASQYAQNAVDSNSAYEDAKEILKLNAQEQAVAKAAKEEADQREATQRYNAFIQDIKNRETNIIQSGKLVNVIVPATERKGFAEANFYDAGNPEHPGMSAIDIRMANMTSEEKDLYRYLVWKNLNVASLVIAKETTKTVTGMLGKGTTGNGSTMSGSSNRVGGDTGDRRLDSPNSK